MTKDLIIDIGRTAQGWDAALADPEELLRDTAAATWKAVGAGSAELSILLADDARTRLLNRDFRGMDRPTNVLSFPAEDKGAPGRPRLLGDVVLSLETLRREADEQSKPLADHLCHLTVHGILHLLGHDHQTESQASAMEALEVEILRGLGVPDPYTAVDQPVG